MHNQILSLISRNLAARTFVDEARMLRLARERIGDNPKLPENIFIEYDEDVDTLYLRFKKSARTTRSDDDLERGLIFDYEHDELVGIEILNANGVFVS